MDPAWPLLAWLVWLLWGCYPEPCLTEVILVPTIAATTRLVAGNGRGGRHHPAVVGDFWSLNQYWSVLSSLDRTLTFSTNNSNSNSKSDLAALIEPITIIIPNKKLKS